MEISSTRAPWMGAVWERLVGLVKIELMKMQMKKVFNEYEWRSHLAEIEAVLNDRPLTYVTDKGTEPDVITPKAILTGSLSETTIGSDSNIDEIFLDVKRYQNQTIELYKEKVKIKEKFWHNLKENYLTMLRSSNYKTNSSRKHFCNKNPEIGDVVVIHEEDMRLKWRIGVIQELIQSSDGQIRAAMVKTTLPTKNIKLHRNLRTTMRRKAINHLYPLELNIEDNVDKVRNMET